MPRANHHNPPGYTKILLPENLPATLRQLHLFQDFNSILNPQFFKNRATRPNRDLGICLASCSCLLESVSASFLIDAEDFFHELWPVDGNETRDGLTKRGLWTNLKTLALTSRLLHPSVRRSEIQKLLLAAASSALFMPKLEVMELWNAGQGHAAYFRFEKESLPTITLRSTWPLASTLLQQTMARWEAVAKEYSQSRLAVSVELLPQGDHFDSYSSLLPHLKLRKQILDVVSLYQIEWEGAHNAHG